VADAGAAVDRLTSLGRVTSLCGAVRSGSFLRRWEAWRRGLITI
jgi:hypothetical protein